MISFESINFLSALGTLALQILAVCLLTTYVYRRSALAPVAVLVQKYALAAALALSAIAMVLAVYYSSGLGIEPCPLCWWQRIFLFPQVVLFALAWWKKDSGVAIYSMALSAIGGVIALYHHALQMLPGTGLPCPATGVSCAQRIMFEFGYITFPLMAVTIFAILLILMLFVRQR